MDRCHGAGRLDLYKEDVSVNILDKFKEQYLDELEYAKSNATEHGDLGIKSGIRKAGELFISLWEEMLGVEDTDNQ